MSKPLRIPAVVAPAKSPLADRGAHINPFTIIREHAETPRQLSVEHKPGKPSIILLKIMAMESHSANAERLVRRRQFYKRYAAPSKTASPRRPNV